MVPVWVPVLLLILGVHLGVIPTSVPEIGAFVLDRVLAHGVGEVGLVDHERLILRLSGSWLLSSMSPSSCGR